MNVPVHHRQGRRVVRRARHGPLGRHAHPVRVGPRQQARRVRAADGHHVPRAHRRGLRRRARKGRKVKAVIPGGSSMPPLDADELDVPMRVRRAADRRAHQARRWSRPASSSTSAAAARCARWPAPAASSSWTSTTDIPKALWRIMKFFAHESCGQCTPCREGTGWLEKVSRRVADGKGKPGDIELLRVDRARHRRQHDLRARRRGGVADARLPHQVPRRLRGADPQGPAAREAPHDAAAARADPRHRLPGTALPRGRASSARCRAGGSRSVGRVTAQRSRRAHGKGMALLFWAFAAIVGRRRAVRRSRAAT